MIKYLLMLLTVTQATTCNRNNPAKNIKTVDFHYATSQTWVGGAMGSGKGINYQFFLTAVDTDYSFDSAWVNGYRLAVNHNSELSGNDTLVLDAAAFFPGQGPKAPEGNATKKGPDESPKPCCEDSKVVIRYSYNGTKNYLSTQELKPLKGIYYR